MPKFTFSTHGIPPEQFGTPDNGPPMTGEKCPGCGVSLEGEGIHHFAVRAGMPKDEALAYAKAYGASPTKGRWGRKIGIYDYEKDRTVAWQCPDCGHQWGR